jgi:hypothetical protein
VGEETSVISSCGRMLVNILNPENKVRGKFMDDPPKAVTCLFCLVGGDETWRQLQQTLKLMEQFGVTVNHGTLNKIEASL